MNIHNKEQEKGKRKLEIITFLQSFAMFLVVIGHSFPIPISPEEYIAYTKIIHKIIYSFHMPLFFVISGYLFIYSMTKKEWNVKFIDFLIKGSVTTNG